MGFALFWPMTAILDNLYSQENYLISKKLLDATHLRHEALANNLANVETLALKEEIYPKLSLLNYEEQLIMVIWAK